MNTIINPNYKIEVVINPDYKYLIDFIYNIPKETYKYDKVFKNDRNSVKKATVNGVQLVIKRYKVPNLIQRFIYTFFRKSKAQRSYEYASRLNKKGVKTANSIAYIEMNKNRLFHTGYYVSEFLDYTLLDEIKNYDYETKSEILKELAKFTIRQHQLGIFNKDYNSTNIFFYKENENWEFAIIDTNRIRFKNKINQNKAARQLKTTTLPITDTAKIIERYANIRGWNAIQLCGSVFNKKIPTIWRRIKMFYKRIKSPSYS